MINIHLHVIGIFAVLANTYAFDPNYVGPGDHTVPNIEQPVNLPNQQLPPINPGPKAPAAVEPIQIGYTASIVPTSTTDVPPDIFPTPPAVVTGGHTACTDSNFGGECKFFEDLPDTGCHNYPVVFHDKWSTIRPNPGQFCHFHDMVDCYGSTLRLEWPGSENLRGKRFDNRVKSWQCWKKDGPRGPE